jgi:hypothetical protein
MQMKKLFFEFVLSTIKQTDNELFKVFKRHY